MAIANNTSDPYGLANATMEIGGLGAPGTALHAYNSADSARMSQTITGDEPAVRITVARVANGYIMRSGSGPAGHRMETHVAANADELRDLFTAALVRAKLGE